MTPDLGCYGDDIPALADLAGDFVLRSPVDTRAWYTRAWGSIAEALGFAQPLAAELAQHRGADDWTRVTGEAGVTAFAATLRAGRPGATDNQAIVQSTVLRQLITAGCERGELWRVTADPTALETGV